MGLLLATEYEPASQFWQTVLEADSANLPLWQFRHADTENKYCPAGHAVQELAPAGAMLPVAHAMQALKLTLAEPEL